MLLIPPYIYVSIAATHVGSGAVGGDGFSPEILSFLAATGFNLAPFDVALTDDAQAFGAAND